MSAAEPMMPIHPTVGATPTAHRRNGCEECGEAHLKCTGHNGQHRPCGRDPMHGTTVCYKHGGSAPQTVEKARLRILEACDPAAAAMVRLLRSKDERVRLKAAADLLDRGGLGAKKGIEVSGPDGEPIPVEVRASLLAEALRSHQAGVGKGTEDV